MKLNIFYAAILSGAVFASQGAVAQETSNDTETAQETAAETTAEQDTGLSLGEEVAPEPKVGDRYAKAEFGDWLIQCIKTEDGNDPCNMFQLMRDSDNNPVAEITMQPLPTSGKAVAGANIVTPLETLLTAQISVTVDKGKAKRYPFAFCTRQGCISRIGLTADDLASYKRGNVAKVVMVPAGAPDRPVELSMSLAGFTAAYDSLK